MSSDEVLQGELVSPEKIGAGRFSVYLAPGERIVLAVRLDGREETERFVVPKMLMRLLSRHAGVDVAAALRGLKDDDAGEG